MILLEQALGIGIAVPLLDFGIRSNFTDKANKWCTEITQKGRIVPLKERRVGDNAFYPDILAAVSGIICYGKTSRRVSRQCYVGMSVAANLSES